MKKFFTLLFLTICTLSQAQNTIELPEGWSLFGYNCEEPLNVEQAFSPIVDSIVIVKNYLGNVYFPEYGVNTIGSFEKGRGYQIKMLHEVQGFEFCEMNCSEVNADSLQQLINTNEELIDSLQSQLSLYGCTDEQACNFSSEAEIDNETCEYAQEGYDCDGNQLLEIGALMYGGIVFYIDETGEHGLVAALEDIYEGSNMGNEGIPEGFEWGCYGDNVAIAHQNFAIGTGLENTQAIVEQGCTTVNGGIAAAQAALNYESGGYSDWYLPSRYELEEMYNTIGNGGSQGNVGNFEISDYPRYWSSSQYSSDGAIFTYLDSGSSYGYNKSISLRVRAIRTFSIDSLPTQLYGCIDEQACNYSSEAEIDNETCEYADQGYDCDGNSIQELEIGALMHGGIVFYIDSTGQRGLVAAIEDLTEGANMGNGGTPEGFEWGCIGEYVSLANQSYAIGTGLENTQAIIYQGCVTENGGITAAQAALNYETEGYSDWYLPSRSELLEMYNTIGNGGAQGNIGGFEGSNYTLYWSSSGYDGASAHGVSFINGTTENFIKSYSLRVRVIRAFNIDSLQIYGCTDEQACNYSSIAEIENESCEYAQTGYDCDGNELEIGALVHGGIVFYIDSTGEHGLVTALEDVTEGANMGIYGTPEGFEWGCYYEDVYGISDDIGAGLENTQIIVNQGCESANGGITAAQAALNFESGGYTDWYLPSRYELEELFNTLESGELQSYIGTFETIDFPSYWSSSLDDFEYPYYVNLINGNMYIQSGSNNNSLRVRAIRSF